MEKIKYLEEEKNYGNYQLIKIKIIFKQILVKANCVKSRSNYTILEKKKKSQKCIKCWEAKEEKKNLFKAVLEV